MKDLSIGLNQQKKQGLYRHRKVTQSPQGREITLDNQRLLNFCSNDYLGLSNHPQVKQSFIDATHKYGVGSGAAHLVNGHTQEHHALEEDLADFCGYPRALLFSTGYMANLAAAQSLCNKNDHIVQDKLNHASLIDAANISQAKLRRFPHKNYDGLLAQLKRCDSGEKLVSSDCVFSMDGDEADIARIIKHCRNQDAMLMLDDAHGFGILGENGQGSLYQQQIAPTNVDIYMATFGKAMGTAGAFIAANEELIETLIQNARCYIYTTAMPAAIAAATRTSLQLLSKENWRQQNLMHNIQHFKSLAKHTGIHLLSSNTAIQPIIIGDAMQALEISQQLLKIGFHVAAIRPPTVLENSARLRVTLRADHTENDIARLITAISQTSLDANKQKR